MTLLQQIDAGPMAQAFTHLPPAMNSLRSRAQLLKMGMQESLLVHRRQIGGPAVGLWQFETGGIKGVLDHKATKVHAKALCAALGHKPTIVSVYEGMTYDDTLAAGFARLNLYWAPGELPDIHDADAGFKYYLNCWRPGAYKRDPLGLRAKWEKNHIRVVEYLTDA